jgi:hypothetical protein
MKPKLKELAALFPNAETEVVIFCAAEDIERILQKEEQFFPSENAGITIAEDSEIEGVQTVLVNDLTFHFVPHTHQKEFILKLADAITEQIDVNEEVADEIDRDTPPADYVPAAAESTEQDETA